MASYTIGECTYDVRRETVKDALQADALARTFPPDTLWEFARSFARYAILTSVNGQPVLGKPIEKVSIAELHAAAEVWGDSDPEAVYYFRNAADEARREGQLNSDHLKPGADAGN